MPVQKKTKTSKINTKLVSDFKKAYADGIVSVCRYLTHSDDSSINCQRLMGSGYLGEYGSIEIIYQAGKTDEDDEINNGHIIFSVDKKIKINDETKIKIQEVIEEVDELLVEDFQEMMRKSGDWYRSIITNDASSILDLNDRIYNKGNKWMFSFTPIDNVDGPLSNGWVPKRVKKIFGEFTSKDYQHNRDILGHYGYETESDDE